MLMHLISLLQIKVALHTNEKY